MDFNLTEPAKPHFNLWWNYGVGFGCTVDVSNGVQMRAFSGDAENVAEIEVSDVFCNLNSKQFLF